MKEGDFKMTVTSMKMGDLKVTVTSMKMGYLKVTVTSMKMGDLSDHNLNEDRWPQGDRDLNVHVEGWPWLQWF